MAADKSPKTSFPVLPLRDIVVFPHMIVPLFVGREKSVRALEDVMATTGRSCSSRRRAPRTTIRAKATCSRSGPWRPCSSC